MLLLAILRLCGYSPPLIPSYWFSGPFIFWHQESKSFPHYAISHYAKHSFPISLANVWIAEEAEMTQIGLLGAKIQKPTTTMGGGRKRPLLSASPISEGSENWLTDKTKELFFCTSPLVTHPQLEERRGKGRNTF